MLSLKTTLKKLKLTKSNQSPPNSSKHFSSSNAFNTKVNFIMNIKSRYRDKTQKREAKTNKT